MALLKKINHKAETDKNSGFGVNANSYGGRFVNKDGTPNIESEVCIYSVALAGITP